MDTIQYVTDLPVVVPPILPFSPLPVFSPPAHILWRGARPMIGKHTERLFQNEVFNISLDNSVTSQQDQVLTCHAVL